MSETINIKLDNFSSSKEYNFANPIPEGYEKLERIEVTENERLYGIVKLGEVERKVQLPDLAEAWGHDPKDRERYDADPEKWDMKWQISELTKRVDALETRNLELETQMRVSNDQSVPEPIPVGKVPLEVIPEPYLAQPELGPAPVREPSPEPAPDPTPPAPTDRRYHTYQTLHSRFRRRLRRESQPPDYYFVDDQQHRYYLDAAGERVYIENDRGGGGRILAIGVSALALLGIGAMAIHELTENDNSPNVRKDIAVLTWQDQHLEQQNSILQRKVTRLGVQETINSRADKTRDKVILAKEEDIQKALDTLHIHVHKYGNHILHQVKAARLEDKKEDSANSGYNSHGSGSASSSSTGEFSGYQYPWDYAHRVYGVNAEGKLHILAAKAAARGHKIRWIQAGILPNGARKEILQVDGTTNTQKVLQIITQYK